MPATTMQTDEYCGQHRVMTLGDGQQIVVADSGDMGRAPAVVAIPGWKGTDAGLRPMLAPLVAAHRRVLTINLPGNGISPWLLERQPTSLAELADLTNRVIFEAVGSAPVVLLGHSFGATIAAAAAANDPRAQIHGLVLISPVATTAGIARGGWNGRLNRSVLNAVTIALSKSPNFLANRVIRAHSIENLSNSVLARRGIAGIREIHRRSTCERGVSPSPKAAACQFHLAAKHTCLESAAAVRAPTWIVAGDRDQMSTLSEIETLSRAFAQCRVAIVSGAGHLAHHEDTDAVRDLVRHAVVTLNQPEERANLGDARLV